jgi:hypothetical protein
MNELLKLSEQESAYSSITVHVLLFQEHKQHADAGRDVPGGPREGGRLPGRRLPGASPPEGLLSEVRYLHASIQCFGSGFDLDSIRSVDLDPDSGSGSGFGIRIRIQEAKNDQQKLKKLRNFMF